MGHIPHIIGLTAGLLLSAGPAVGDQHPSPRQLGAHQHGIAELNLVVEGEVLLLELTTPADNLLGFEHRARSAADKDKLSRTLALLRRGTPLFRPTAAAACELQLAEIDSPLVEGDAQEDHEHAHEEKEEGGGHSEFQLGYRFHCQHPEALTGVEVRLWEHFAGFERIHGQLIGPRGQQRFELGPDQRRIHF